MKKSALLFILLSCLAPAEDVRQSILSDPKSPYYVDFSRYPRGDRSLPVGVFDSGTGGLTVLNAIVQYDEHNNRSGLDGADGEADFCHEDMIYLADQANMPYGNYASEGKTDLLIEHILKCAQFLLGNRYYGDGPKLDKKPVKVVVIACNTATAYGKTSVEELLKQAPSDLKVIGVIDAGARGALSVFGPQESGSVGIFATTGTVASGGYVRAIRRLQSELGLAGDVQTFSQGGLGLAEAIDEEPDFIDRKATTVRPNYRGPKVDVGLLPFYHFNQDPSSLLCDGPSPEECSCVQINSPENYARFHIVSLLESMRKEPSARPLKAIILGCTHYPYVQEHIDRVLGELRQQDRYQALIGDQVVLVDPAVNTARELYTHLHQQKLENSAGSLENSEFYISVPNPEVPGAQLEAAGSRFSYAYKYGRTAGQGLAYVRNVPFSRQNIPAEVASRLRQQIPAVYRLIQRFEETNAKTRFLAPDQRL
ncbi:aspartate/glutamate racemase family protein [bacterium]|nr:aspartate/glutamate racemase family protein [bacterium]